MPIDGKSNFNDHIRGPQENTIRLAARVPGQRR